MQTINVGHIDTMMIVYLDAAGNPMLVTPTPDASPGPAWSEVQTPAGVDTLTVSPDGTVAVLTALAVGSDAVSVSLSVGGQKFTASDVVTVTASPQVLTSVAIQHNIQ